MSQSLAFFDQLLPLLADPLDSTANLKPVLNDNNEVTGLQSRDRHYPVDGNIPCLIPDWSEIRGRYLSRWRSHQEEMWRQFQRGDTGALATSPDNPLAELVSKRIRQSGSGRYLDVGCGVIPQPAYMESIDAGFEWFGIDPYLGDTARQFPFVQGLGEYLPFRPGTFDGIVYVAALEHMLAPSLSLHRARRLLKPGGNIFIWTILDKENHQNSEDLEKEFIQVFTKSKLLGLLKNSGFSLLEEVYLCEHCPSYPFCNHRYEHFFIAK